MINLNFQCKFLLNVLNKFNCFKLHGFGAKQFLLNKFVDQTLSQYNCITFECFIPGINCRKIFDTISDEFDIKISHRMHSLNEWADKLRTEIENKYNNFFIGFHNIDANDLRFFFFNFSILIFLEILFNKKLFLF